MGKGPEGTEPGIFRMDPVDEFVQPRFPGLAVTAEILFFPQIEHGVQAVPCLAVIFLLIHIEHQLLRVFPFLHIPHVKRQDVGQDLIETFPVHRPFFPGIVSVDQILCPGFSVGEASEIFDHFLFQLRIDGAVNGIFPKIALIVSKDLPVEDQIQLQGQGLSADQIDAVFDDIIGFHLP